MINGPEAAPNKMAAPTTTGRSLESSQIQDCSSGKLSGKAFHTSTATVTAVLRELCFRKAKKNLNKCEQTGFGRSTALFSSARSRLTSLISPWCVTLVWSTHGLVSAFFHVGRQFGTSRPNTLACRLRKRPWSFLMRVTIVTPNTIMHNSRHITDNFHHKFIRWKFGGFEGRSVYFDWLLAAFSPVHIK